MRDQQAHQQQPREEEPPQQLEVQGQIAAAQGKRKLAEEEQRGHQALAQRGDLNSEALRATSARRRRCRATPFAVGPRSLVLAENPTFALTADTVTPENPTFALTADTVTPCSWI